MCRLGVVPLACGGSGEDPCIIYGAVCDSATNTCACNPKICTAGINESCNLDPAVSAQYGTCTPFGSCVCTFGDWDSSTGKCVAPICPATVPKTGDSCVHGGQTCSYLPNTTCTCTAVNAPAPPVSYVWLCAL